MKVVPPVPITPDKLIACNVPENDHPVWSAGTVKQGDRRIFERVVYEVLAETTTDSPIEGLTKVPATWLVIGPANRWRMFEKRAGNTWLIGTYTENPESIDVTIRPGKRINSIGLVGVLGATVQVQMLVAGEVVYDVTQPMSVKAGGSWYRYYFGAFVTRDNFARLDLPPAANADIRVVVRAPGGKARVGMLIMGMSRDLGSALWGSGIGFDSYSNVKEDTFGNVTITPRGKRDYVDFDVSVYTNQVPTVKRVLGELKDSPALYIGSETVDPTILVGRFDRFQLVLSNVTLSEYTLEVRSLM